MEDIELQVLNNIEPSSQNHSINPLSQPSQLSISSEQDETEASLLRASIQPAETSPSVAGLASVANLEEQRSNITVDIHHKKNLTSSNPVTLLKAEALKDPQFPREPNISEGVLFSAEESESGFKLNSENTGERMMAEVTENSARNCLRSSITAAGSSGGRRFSNISNLAYDLSSTTTSAPRLQGNSDYSL